jgi:hypothetical protein
MFDFYIFMRESLNLIIKLENLYKVTIIEIVKYLPHVYKIKIWTKSNTLHKILRIQNIEKKNFNTIGIRI